MMKHCPQWNSTTVLVEFVPRERIFLEPVWLSQVRHITHLAMVVVVVIGGNSQCPESPTLIGPIFRCGSANKFDYTGFRVRTAR